MSIAFGVSCMEFEPAVKPQRQNREINLAAEYSASQFIAGSSSAFYAGLQLAPGLTGGRLGGLALDLIELQAEAAGLLTRRS